MKSFVFFVPLLAAISVSAHGFIDQFTVDGKVFPGNIPSKATKQSAIRQISDPSPIKGAANPSVNCGTDAKPASLVADANPGSKLTFSWKGEDLSNVCFLPISPHSGSHSALVAPQHRPHAHLHGFLWCNHLRQVRLHSSKMVQDRSSRPCRGRRLGSGPTQ